MEKNMEAAENASETEVAFNPENINAPENTDKKKEESNPSKKKRGRPKKSPENVVNKPKRKRGRPRKDEKEKEDILINTGESIEMPAENVEEKDPVVQRAMVVPSITFKTGETEYTARMLVDRLYDIYKGTPQSLDIQLDLDGKTVLYTIDGNIKISVSL